jgi:hypothetical protein
MSQIGSHELIGYNLIGKKKQEFQEEELDPEAEFNRLSVVQSSSMRGKFKSNRPNRGGKKDRGNYKGGSQPKKFFNRIEIQDDKSLLESGEVDRLVDEVFQFIKENNLPPVTARDVFPQSKFELWNNLKPIEFVKANDEYATVLGNSPRENYILKPRIHPQGIERKLDPRYRVLIGGWDTYESADRITDFYQEECRLDSYLSRLRILEVNSSPNDMWFNHPNILRKWIRSAVIRYTNKLKNQDIEVESIDVGDVTFKRELLESLFNDKVHVSQYRVTWVVSIIAYFKQFINIESMLDPSMGWGDRLLGAMKMGVKYTGFDPNTKLHPGYKRMIEDLADDQSKYSATMVGFEDAIISEEVDFILTSPPYKDVEIYSNEETQSIIKFKDNWMEGFYDPYLLKAWGALRDGGILVLQIGDSRNFKMVDHTIKLFKRIDGCIHWGQFITYANVGKCGNLHLVYRKYGKGEYDSI